MSPSSDPLGFWPISSQRVLLLIWLVIACTVQGRNHGTVTLGRVPHPRHRRQSPHGTWTHWGSWSACSSTCGDGVSIRSRRCIRFPAEESCQEKPRQYRLCDLQECPSGSGSGSFRAMQCSLYNSRPILGEQTQYQWVPFHGAANLCDLNCLAVGHNFYYTFGRVLDGTPCSRESADLCISGQCLRAGCDRILGSRAQADACGVCAGRNESCVLVQEAFRVALPTSGVFGYRNVTRIPAGARQIRVTDRSRNYLGYWKIGTSSTSLMNANQHYILNGDWAIDQPGAYEVAGTQLHYARTASLHETLEAAGPTTEDLFVMVLFQEQNLSIDYQFWLPREQLHHMEKDTSILRQQQARDIEADPPGEPPNPLQVIPGALRPPNVEVAARREAMPPPPRTSSEPGRCEESCVPPRGKPRRVHHYCQSDFVFRARILSKRYVGSETRYDVHVQQTYRSRFPLLPREFVWVPNTCDCPRLLERREYALMARRHVNFEHTLNRLVLPPDGYARPWSPHEARLLRDAAPHCLLGPGGGTESPSTPS